MKKQMFKGISILMILMTVLVGCTTANDGSMNQTDNGTQMEDTMTSDDDTMMDDEEDMMTDDEMMDEDGETAGMGMIVEGSNAEDMVVEGMTDNGMMDDEMMTNEGQMAPDFELMDLNGNVYKSSDLLGEKVYIKYWASWCPICLAGLSEIDELSGMDTDFTVLTIVTPNANGEQSAEDFKTWYKSLEYNHITVLLDEKGALAKQLRVRAFPTSVFIGSDGVLIESLPGHKSNEEIMNKIDSFY